MTSAQVKNTNVGLMEFIGRANQSLSVKNEFQDFSKVMREKTQTIESTKATPKKEIETEHQPDSKPVMSQEKSSNKLEEPTEVEDGKLQEAIEKAVDEVKNEIANTLDISVEELEQVMRLLGMTDATLLDPTKLPQIFAEVIGEEPFTILVNEELSGTLNELIEVVNQNMDKIVEEFNILPEEVIEVAKEQGMNKEMELVGTSENANLGNEEVKNPVDMGTIANVDEVAKEVSQKTQQEAKVTIGNDQEVIVEISKNETQNDMSGNSNGTSEEKPNETAGGNVNGKFNEKTDESLNTSKTVDSSSNVVQNFAENVVNELENAVKEITYTQESVDAEGIMKQIVNHVKIGVSKEVTTMELQLHPESLGRLDLQVSMKDGNLVAEFSTENEAVKNIIEGQLIQLKETLEAQGLKVSSVEVSVAEKGLQQDMNQNSENNGGFNEPQKQNVRKINLQGITNFEDIELEQMNEEEQLATKLMLEKGNTVDYTA